jgi:tRNA pseudouridine(55) synthase
MASGKLLILIGEECKHQEKYHALDKEYIFEVMLGVGSDTGDMLGLLEFEKTTNFIEKEDLEKTLNKLVGPVSLPYPKFSSKTVKGKPLHLWTLEGRLDEIEIPTKKSFIHKLQLIDLRTELANKIYSHVTKKIETIPPVTETSKALGNDFRRPLVREAWKNFQASRPQNTKIQIATIRCIASSGTYMRTLASVIANDLNTLGLAYSIHRTQIGRYKNLGFNLGFWGKKY